MKTINNQAMEWNVVIMTFITFGLGALTWHATAEMIKVYEFGTIDPNRLVPVALAMLTALMATVVKETLETKDMGSEV